MFKHNRSCGAENGSKMISSHVLNVATTLAPSDSYSWQRGLLTTINAIIRAVTKKSQRVNPTVMEIRDIRIFAIMCRLFIHWNLHQAGGGNEEIVNRVYLYWVHCNPLKIVNPSSSPHDFFQIEFSRKSHVSLFPLCMWISSLPLFPWCEIGHSINRVGKSPLQFGWGYFYH